MEKRKKEMRYHHVLFKTGKRNGMGYRYVDEGWWCNEKGSLKGLVTGCSLDEGQGMRRAALVRRILTCFAPGQAPHQSRVSGCQCWHTS